MRCSGLGVEERRAARLAGRAFAEYRHKLAELLRGLDADGHADADVAMLQYEGWLR